MDGVLAITAACDFERRPLMTFDSTPRMVSSNNAPIKYNAMQFNSIQIILIYLIIYYFVMSLFLFE